MYMTIHKRAEKGASVKQLAAWHHVSKSTVAKYAKYIESHEGTIERTKKAGKWYWTYYNPIERQKEREKRKLADSTLRREHDEIIKKDYWLDDFERHYESNLKADVAAKIQRATWVDQRTRDHIKRHLGL